MTLGPEALPGIPGSPADAAARADAGHRADAAAPLPFAGCIVGLGASAGGLDALDRFFSALPPCPDVAFVVVQHLAPDHRTMMDDLLSRRTSMPVQVVEPDMPVQGGHVYVIAPGKMMVLNAGRLQLTPKPATGLTLPIDAFFESLAQELGPRAIGVVLSGTGSDGTRGCIALDAAGAWVLAQAPASARFDGMPRSAIATGVVDRVLDPEELAAEVASLLEPGHAPRPPHAAVAAAAQDEGALERTLAALARATRIPFSEYKPATILRRLDRRLQATHCATLDDYLTRLVADPAEPDALRQELLIPVTAFFRDREAFDALREQVLRPLVRARAGSNEPVRVWVCATATGEEAYSVALMLEALVNEQGGTPPYKIFATDVEPRFLAQAGAGRYPVAVLDAVEPALRTPLTVTGDTLEVSSALRQHILFARHDVLVDAPFTQIDLVCCRNMLIYLRPAAQERVLRRLEQALRVGGALFLGGSESLLGTRGEFDAVDSKHKLYRLRHRPPPLPPSDLLSVPPLRGRSQPPAAAAVPHVRAVEQAVDALLAQYAPPSLVITGARELVHVFGEARRYLRFPAGGATLDVLQLIDPLLSPVVATLVHAAQRDGQAQVSRPVPLAAAESRADLLAAVQLRVLPLPDTSGAGHLLVAFERADPPAAAGDGALPVDVAFAGQQHIADLERELAETRGNLYTTIQDLGTTNEELQALNEELMASNEELQGTNEELQSVNEELHTVNAELQTKIEALNSANADLEGLTRASQLPTVFVDHELRVLRFTPEALPLFRLREGDVGRRLDDLAHTLDYADLFADLQRALSSNESRLREVRAADGRSFLATVLPYRSGGTGPAKAVATFVDISHLKDAQRLQEVLDALPAHVAVLDRDGVIRHVNRGWIEFGHRNDRPEHERRDIGTSYLDVCRSSAPGDATAQLALDTVAGVLGGRLSGGSLIYPCHSATEQRWFLMHVTPLTRAEGGAVVSHLNITGWLPPVDLDAWVARQTNEHDRQA